MNYLRTAILLAGLTALFMTVGYLIGGGAGVVIAFVIAAANQSIQLLERRQARVIDARRTGSRRAQRAGIGGDCARTGTAGRPADAAGLFDGQPATQCIRHRAQSATRRRLCDDRAP